MFDERFVDSLGDRIAAAIVRWLQPKLEALDQKLWPRWMSVETAGEYIDKTYEGMRYTLKEFPHEIPIAYVGDKPRIDKTDIDRFMMNRKGK